MNIALILASGQGSRIKTSNIPKQFIEINNKPIVLHTIERFILNINVDVIVITCHPEWMDYLNNLINDKYASSPKKIHIIDGGGTRNDSIHKGIVYIEKTLKPKDNDIVLTHDAVRMFVSDRIINENFDKCKQYDAIDTVVPSIDTIVVSDDGKSICDIPDRSKLYNGQTPQTFKYQILKEAYTQNKIADTSDICKLVMKDIKIHIVMGEYENFKITTDLDLDYAKKLVVKSD